MYTNKGSTNVKDRPYTPMYFFLFSAFGCFNISGKLFTRYLKLFLSSLVMMTNN